MPDTKFAAQIKGFSINQLMDLLKLAYDSYPLVAPIVQKLLEIINSNALPPIRAGAVACGAPCSDLLDASINAQLEALAATIKAYQCCDHDCPV